MEFRHTDLPEPVAPAMSRWGMLARSAATASPETPEPSAIGSAALSCSWRNDGASITARSVTMVALVFGTSMPTIGLPGTGASMRSAGAASASARSF